jgi:hypothetical protein
LKDVVVSAERACSDVDVDVVFQEILSKTTNFFRPGSRPHEDLSVWTNLFNDFSNLRLEPHVQHSEKDKCITVNIKCIFDKRSNKRFYLSASSKTK